jgi:hypothetical protein
MEMADVEESLLWEDNMEACLSYLARRKLYCKGNLGKNGL